MSKIGLVIKREFESRVKKKSFLLVTLLVPLIFPAIMGVMVYFAMEEEKNAEQKQVLVLDEEGFQFEDDRKYAFERLTTSIDEAKVAFNESDAYALLYVPKLDIQDPEGVVLYVRKNPSLEVNSFFEKIVESQIKERKLKASGITEDQLAGLKTNITLRAINLSDTGEEKESSAGIAFGLAYAFSFLVYMFVFIYGSQIMQGVIEEKSNKIVEIVVSSIKPFQLMVGKVIGVAAVGIVQFAIWVILIGVLSTVVFSVFNLTPEDIQAAQSTMPSSSNQEMVGGAMNSELIQTMQVVYDIPYGYYISVFIFFFISGYLLYGALFAAVGSAVDNISDAQQFTLPVTLPMIIGFLGTFMFVMREPDGNVSFWLSVIPFTSPVAMMARVAFGVPAWELALSMGLMILGFVFTIWLAGRIYRIGILMHGTKVTYKTLFKWIKTSN